jgi:hypothetical protein
MCAVAGRGLFRGYGADDLAAFGIGFSLFHMPALSVLASRIVCEEQALRRPIRVTLSEAGASAHETLETRTAVPIRPAIVPDQELDRDAPARLVMAAAAG